MKRILVRQASTFTPPTPKFISLLWSDVNRVPDRGSNPSLVQRRVAALIVIKTSHVTKVFIKHNQVTPLASSPY